MPLVVDGKRQIAVIGNMHPVKIMDGNRTIVRAVESTKSGTALSWDGTYNDRFTALSATGGTTQAADYQACEGESTQVVTVQGKNLFRTDEIFLRHTDNLWVYQIVTLPAGTYITSYFGSTCVRLIKDEAGTTNIVAAGTGTFTLAVGRYRVYINNPAGFPPDITPADIMAQIESGTARTAYAPFVPDSPSPDYPSPITPYVVGGTYRLPGTTLETAIPDLHGMGAVRDRVVWDRLSGILWVDGLWNERVFDGTDSFVGTNPFYISKANLGWDSKPSSNGVYCTHYVVTTAGVTTMPNGSFKIPSDSSLWFKDDRFTIAADFNTWIASMYAENNPLIILYPLAAPTRTPLTLTDNPSSTAPELPMEAFAPELSPDYPRYWYDKGGNNAYIKDRFGVIQQTIPIPKLAEGEVYDAGAEAREELYEDVILDGSPDEGWQLPTTVVPGYSSYRLSPFFNVANQPFRCSHFETFESMYYYQLPYQNRAACFPNSKQLIILVSNDIAPSNNQTDTTAWRAWLAANPITIRRLRATPLSIPQEPIAVQTYYGHTEITQDGPPDTQCEITATCRVVDI